MHMLRSRGWISPSAFRVLFRTRVHLHSLTRTHTHTHAHTPGWKDGTRVTFVGEERQAGAGSAVRGGEAEMWEVVCVIREVTHAHFSRHGQDLRYRVCVTESALGDGDGVRAFVPLLGGGGVAQHGRGGKGTTGRGMRRSRAGAGGHAGGDGAGGVQVHFAEEDYDLSLLSGGGLMGHKICQQVSAWLRRAATERQRMHRSESGERETAPWRHVLAPGRRLLRH